LNDVRKERQVKNEILFRSLNERVRKISDARRLDRPMDRADSEIFLCECADETCTQRISMTRSEYEHVRRSPIQFVVAPGHAVPDIENVVEGTDRFVIVAKRPGEQTLAQATDPRGPGPRRR
jgi:5-bromo-4-chloroindolyl phosphate hydrolysis protein